MPQANLEAVVQRMIDAGEPEENIGAVIKELSAKQPWTPGQDSLAGFKARGPQVLSDSPSAPDWKSNLNAAMQGVAHPQTLSDMAPLLLPGMGVEGAVAREGPGLLRGVKQAPANALGGAARVAEAGGRVSPSVGAQVGGWVAGGPGASIGAAAPAASRGVGSVLRRGEALLRPRQARILTGAEQYAPAASYGPSTVERGTNNYNIPEPTAAPPATSPAPILRKAGTAPPSTAATMSQEETIGEALRDLSTKEKSPTGTTPPEPTITSPGREGDFASSGRPSVTSSQYDEIVEGAGKTGSPAEPPSDIERMLRDSLAAESAPGGPNVARAMSDIDGSRDAARILRTTPEAVKSARGDSISALPERARASVDAGLKALLERHASHAELRAYIHDTHGNALSRSHIEESLKRGGTMDEATIADLMKR